MKKQVLNESGQVVDLPEGDYNACGHTHPGAPVKASAHDRLQCGFWGQAPGPSGYYHAYYWNAGLGRAFFEIGCPHSASHMRAEVGKAALRVEVARLELTEAERSLEALKS